MLKKEALDQSGFLFSKKDFADKSSASSSQNIRVKAPDFKLWVSDLLTIKKPQNQESDFYSFCGFSVNTVDIYGVVTQVFINSFGVLYKVDDGTGEIDCWHDGRSKPNKENLRSKVETIMSAIQQSSFDKAVDIKEPQPSTSANYCTSAKSPQVEVAEWLKSQILSASECVKDTYDLGDTVHVRGKLSEYRGSRCIRIYNIREVFDMNETIDRRFELLHLYKACYSKKETSVISS